MTLIAYFFPKLQTAKDVVGQISKKPRFRTPLDSQHVKGSQTLVKSVRQFFYHTSSSLCAKLTWKLYPLVICEILEAFVNNLTVDEKYPLRNSDNLPLPIQMQLSKKQKTFSFCFCSIC